MPQENDSIQPASIKRIETPDKRTETPEAKAAELREDIARTRSALSEDVRALGERIKPERLKEDAKEMIQHAADATREGAKHMVHDAKDAAIDSLRNAKEHAFESISEGGRQIGIVARRAGRDVSDFVATNALPLALLGAGAGWLLVTMNHARRLRLQGGDGESYYGNGQIYGAVSNARERVGELTDRASHALSDGRDFIRERAHDVSTSVSDRVGEVRTKVKQGAAYLGHEAGELGHRAYEGIEWAGRRTKEVSGRSPLLIGLLALGAGAAVAMLLPSSRRENTLMGGTRDRLVHKAQESASELKGSLQRGADGVRDALDELSAGRA